MNSLKVIDEEIKYWQKTINTARSEKTTQKIIVSLNPLYKVENAILSDYEILLIEEKLQTLQQIKSELEAYDKRQKELSEIGNILQEKNDYIFDLEQNVNTLEEECVTLVSRLEFYKRTVSFFKELFFIDIIQLENGYFKIGFAPKEPIKNTRFTDIPTIEIAKHLYKALEVEDE